MFFCLILSIAYRSKFVIYTSKSQYEMPSFGFDANGTYFIDILNIPTDIQSQIQIAFLNKKEYKNYFFKFFPPSICDLQNIPKYYLNSSHHAIKGTFSEKIDLFPFLLRCDTIFEYLDLTVITEYQNPTTHLDNRMVKGINAQMFICILFFALSIVWLANLFFNFKSFNGLHNCITIIILFFMFSHMLRFCELQKLDKSDDSNGITNSRIIFSYFGATFLCLFFLIGSEGYCTLIDSLSNQRIFQDLLMSAFFCGCLYLTLYFHFSENFNMIIILDLVAAVLYGHELFSAMKRANVQVVALLLAASNADADQGATSFQKNRQYNYFQRILMAVLSIIIFFLLFSYIFFLLQNWLIELFIDLSEISVLCVTAFIFRPRKSSSLAPSSGIENRLIDDDNENIINDVDNGDEIQLNSLDNTTDILRNGPTPDQPLLQQNPSAEHDKKVNGNNYVFL